MHITSRQLRSDNEPHFIAEVIKEYFTLVGVGQYITLAYSKEENVIVERYNKEINQQLRALTFGDVSLDEQKFFAFRAENFDL